VKMKLTVYEKAAKVVAHPACPPLVEAVLHGARRVDLGNGNEGTITFESNGIRILATQEAMKPYTLWREFVLEVRPADEGESE